MEAFFIGLQFLTRISIVKQTVWTEESFGNSVKFFPAVGAVLGISYVIINIIFSFLLIGDVNNLFSANFPMLRASIILIAMTFLTGAIHCDGFMDTMDGLFSGRDRNKMLEIMKDSRVGAFGVVSFVILSIFEFASLAELAKFSNFTLIAAIYTAPIIGRFMMVLTIGGFPYARPEGMGKAFSERTTRATMVFAAIETLILMIPIVLMSVELVKSLIISIILTLIFTLRFGKFSVKKIGGVTGDIYGAVTMVSEAIVFLSFIVLESYKF